MAKVYIGDTEILTQSQGDGLTQTEKNLILTLFEKSAYAEDDAETAYTALSELWAEYDITWVGSGYTKSNSATSVSVGGSFSSTITANTGFTVTNVTVTMGGNTVQGAWSNGRITIPNVTGNIVITVTTSQVTVSSISAVYTQSGTVYEGDSLDGLKSDLVVTATFMDSSTGVINPADYTLSGTLAVGTSTITVTYGGKSDTFNVTVTELVDFEIDFTNMNYTERYAIMTNGAIGTFEGWGTYDDIDVSRYSSITYSQLSAFDYRTTYIFGLSFYDSNGNFILGVGKREASSSVYMTTRGASDGYLIAGTVSVPSNATNVKITIAYAVPASTPVAHVPNVTLNV